jgi:hypothetical protein
VLVEHTAVAMRGRIGELFPLFTALGGYDTIAFLQTAA